MEFINTDWKIIIQDIIEKNFPKLFLQIEKERLDFDGLAEIYPPKEEIFHAFNFFDFNELKVIIIGQDPYHQPKQANGLAFSVADNIKIPPSLVNIFKEIYKDNLEELPKKNGNLEYLAKQGVLLLNNSLTVRQSNPNSHLKYWKGFSDKIVKYINDNSEKKIFLLWGNNAKKMKKFINLEKHLVLEATHPSPLGANKGGWFGCDHFNKANKFLIENKKEIINWKY
jgi:uracil-DNA glycosylase